MDKDINFWNRVSKLYTPLQEKQNQDVYFQIAELSKIYTKDKDVLELASGTGQITKYLYTVSKSYIATDYSPKMVMELDKRNFEGLKTEVADATNLTYPDNSFDVVIIANALHIMPLVDKAMEEIKRVLKKDGILIAPTFVYDRKINKFKLFITKLAGFKTYHKWGLNDLSDYIKKFDYEILDKSHLKAKPAYIGFIVSKNNK